MKEKKTSRDIKMENTHQLILDAANRLFKERKYDEVSIKDICDASGTSVGTFYHHFGCKEHLVELFYQEFDNYIGKFFDDFNSLPPLGALYSIIGHEMDYLCTNVTYPSQICVMQLISGAEAFDEVNRTYYKCLQRIVDRIFDCDATRGIEKTDFFEAILRYTRGDLYDWCLHNGSYDLKSQVLWDVSLFMEGLFSRGYLIREKLSTS